MDIPEIVREEFTETAKEREEDPEEVIERLMVEYVRHDNTISELFAPPGEPVSNIDEYVPYDSRPIGYNAAAVLPTRPSPIEIDPQDVVDDELPQNREVKRALICGVLRYRRNRRGVVPDRRHESVIRRDDVVAAAMAIVGEIDTDYKQSEYVDQVMDELLIRNPADDQMAFLSPEDVLAYLKSLKPGEGIEAEDDIYSLSRVLVERYRQDIDLNELNHARERFHFDPIE